MPTSGNYFHLHLVSDSTGETLITVARAVAAQYTNVTPVEHVYPLVRSQKQLDRVLDEIEEAPGIVLFTLLEKDLVGRLEAKCKDINIPSLSIIGPVMQLFEAYLGAATAGRVGAQHVLNAEYFARIDALNYTMLHDDGQLVDGSGRCGCRAGRRVAHLEDADLDLSRQSRRPHRQCAPGAGHSDSTSIGDLEEAAGRQPARDAGAADSGAAEPSAQHGC